MKRKYAVCWGALISTFQSEKFTDSGRITTTINSISSTLQGIDERLINVHYYYQKTIYISTVFPNLLFLVSQCRIPFCTRKENLYTDYRLSSFVFLVGDCCFSWGLLFFRSKYTRSGLPVVQQYCFLVTQSPSCTTATTTTTTSTTTNITFPAPCHLCQPL